MPSIVYPVMVQGTGPAGRGWGHGAGIMFTASIPGRDCRSVSPVPPRDDGHLGPELNELFDEGDHFMEMEGFDHIAIGVETIGADDVILRIGGGDHDDRDVAETFILFDLQEELPAVDPGHVEIEQDEIRQETVGSALWVLEKIQRLPAAVHRLDLRIGGDLCNGLGDDLGLGRIVINDEDFA